MQLKQFHEKNAVTNHMYRNCSHILLFQGEIDHWCYKWCCDVGLQRGNTPSRLISENESRQARKALYKLGILPGCKQQVVNSISSTSQPTKWSLILLGRFHPNLALIFF